MSAPIVFFDIAGPEDSQIRAFYSAVFGWEQSANGNFSTAVVPAVNTANTMLANIRHDPAQKIIYVGVQSIGDTLEKIVKNGGEVVKPRFEVPGVVILGLFRDPAGNSMGLIELQDDQIKIP